MRRRRNPYNRSPEPPIDTMGDVLECMGLGVRKIFRSLIPPPPQPSPQPLEPPFEYEGVQVGPGRYVAVRRSK